MPDKKILVVTLTCGRLPVSKQWVPTLAEKAGYPYRHLIVDNGSPDGSPDWFEDNGYEVLRHTDNLGVADGWKSGYEYARSWKPDYVVRMDDDCDVESDDILMHMMRFYHDNGDAYVTSPKNVNLENSPKYMPKTVSKKRKLSGHNVNLTTHSGLFVCVPGKAFEMMCQDGMKKGDNRRGAWWRSKGYPTAYLTDLRVHHMGRNTSTYDKYQY